MVRWDGTSVPVATLDLRLLDAATGNAGRTSPDARAPFGLVDRTLATVKRAGVTRLGFEGNQRYKAF